MERHSARIPEISRAEIDEAALDEFDEQARINRRRENLAEIREHWDGLPGGVQILYELI